MFAAFNSSKKNNCKNENYCHFKILIERDMLSPNPRQKAGNNDMKIQVQFIIS